jgi:modulator of FtsH protease HflC
MLEINMKTGLFGSFTIAALSIMAFLTWNAFFTVYQTEQVLVLRFGKVVNVITEPGLNVKLPFVDSVVKRDKLILDVDVPGTNRPQGEEVITADEPDQKGVLGEERKRLVVDAFARYRIHDPLKFYQTVGSVEGAKSRLSVVIISAVRRVLGGVRLSDIVREKREVLMAEIRKQVDDESKNLGIEIVDVRLRRADLPPTTSESVFNSMKAQFKQQATDIRSRGEQRAQEMRADAERRATIIRAEAQQKADEARGEGEGERNRIFAEAFGRNADFFSFYRSLQAYEAGFKGNNTRMVIAPDSPFFKYLNDPNAKLRSSNDVKHK